MRERSAKRPGGTPILLQIGGLLIATIAIVTAVSLAVVALAPSPSPRRVTLMQVQKALLSDRQAAAAGLDRTIVQTAPYPQRSRSGELYEAALAYSLRRPREDLRVELSPQVGTDGASIEVVDPAQGPISVTVTRDPSALIGPAAEPIFRAVLDPDFVVPAFDAALRRSDDSWAVVRPASPWLSGWRLRLFAAFALSAMLLAPIAWLAARRLTKPIRTLASFAEQADLESGAGTVTVAGPREVRAAAIAIEAMRRRLRQQSEERLRMLAAVAHDLRTPLTSLRLRAESAPARERRKMAADISRMNTMIGQVLEYVADHPADAEHEQFDLIELVRTCIENCNLSGPQLTESLGDGPLLVRGDRIALSRAILNLLENARRYGGGGAVKLERDGDFTTMTVQDRGPGIAGDLLERVKEPFYRAEASRSLATGGTGLGLAIATAVAARHGGDVTLSNAPDGGLVAQLRVRNG